LAQRHIAAPNDWIYSTLKRPKVLKIQISKVGKVAVYANSFDDVEIDNAYQTSDEWLEIENVVLKKLKEEKFFLLTKEQMNLPFAFEFDKENPIHFSLLDSNLVAGTRKPLLFDFFFYWGD
jgi:hypothetical protein